MNDNRHGLLERAVLTEAEIEEITALATLSSAHEPLRMRLEVEMLQGRSGTEVNDFLYFEQGRLIGCLAISDYGDDVRELVGTVDPDYRRRGVFRSLLEAAKVQLQARGGKEALLICEKASTSGQAFVRSLNLPLEHSEHEMELKTFRPKNTLDDRLTVRKADMADLEALIVVMKGEFDDDEQAREHLTRLLQRPGSIHYLATLGEAGVGCKEPIGVLRIDQQQEIGIYGFVVRSEYRGRGYGRQILEETIREVQQQTSKAIMLDVDTTNLNALGLYLSCGFETRTTYDYYILNLVN